MWKTVKLGDVCNFQNGRAFKKSEWGEVGLPIIRIANLKPQKTEHNFYSGDYDERIFIERGDLLLSWSGTVKPFIWPHSNALLNQHVFKVGTSESIEKSYAFYLLQSLLTALSKEKVGIGLQHITKKTFDNFPINLPSLAEQQRIVAKLDAAFAEIDRAIEVEQKKHSEAIALKSQAMTGWLAQNSLQEATFKVGYAVDEGWIQAPFDGNHGEIHPKAKDYTNSGVPFLMASDLRNGHVDLTNCKFLSRELADSLRKGFAKDKDVLLTHKGTIGEIAVLSCNFDYVMLTPQVTAYRVLNEERVSREFLYYQFQSEHFQKQLKEIAGIGTTRAYIGITRQKELQIHLPPIQLQKDAVNLMQTIEPNVGELTRIATEKIAQLSSLKSAILAQELQPPQSEAA